MNRSFFRKTVFVVITALLFAGCGYDEIKENAEENGIETSDSDSLSPAEDPEAPVSSDSDENPAAASKEAYERFLNDQEPIYFDRWNLDGEWLEEEENYGKRFREGTPYRFEEMINAFVECTDVYDGEYFRMGRVEYAYIDCGADEVPELAIRIADYKAYIGDMSEVYIIKLIDDKLQLCYSFDYGYRTDTSINEYGYILSEGSTGAVSFDRDESFLNAACEEIFVYELSAEYIRYDEYRFALEALALKPSYEYEDYDTYDKDLIHTYWLVDDQGEWIDDESTYPYCEYINDSSTKYFTHSEVEDMLREHREKLGITDTIVNGKEPEWTVLIDAPEADPEPVIVQNPSWEYYCDDSLTEASSHISLVKISQKTNGIVDDDDWFDSLGITRPGREYQSDNDHYFHLYGGGDVGFEPDTLEISDTGGSMIAVLDFYAFFTPDTCYSHPAFVSETIHSPKIEDGILYISTFHNTYASSAPHNGYITAIDMNDGYKVLWKTEPLTCNAENFVIAGDTIICGYGFTDEDDFIYLLDKNTGKRIDTIKVKTGPEYFHLTDDNLYVRTYDTDYVFKING